MRLHPAAGWAPALLVALGGLLAAGPATAATVTCGTASGVAGQTVTVNLTTTDLTGLGVVACQFRISYTASLVTAVGVSTDGTLMGAAGWGTPTFNVASGRIDVAAAGTTALTGAGTLVKVSFTIDPAHLTSGSTTLTLSNCLLNEGTPSATTVNGTITVNATPVITVSPNTGEIVRGATLQFSVSGSVVNPVSWYTTDAGLASIGSAGLLTALAPGTVRVFAVDNAGKRDTTGDIVIRHARVTVGSTSALMGEAVSVPVTVTDLTGLGLGHGELQITFDNRYLSLVSATYPAGTLLHDWGGASVGASSVGNTTRVTVSFGGGGDLSGSGTLFYLNLMASTTHYGAAALELILALFDETIPALRSSGSVNVAAPATFSVLPANVTLLAGETRQFTLSGSPVLPITWSTLDPAVATIDEGGLLTAVAGGVTRVQAVDNSGGTALNTSVTVCDFALTAGSPTILPGGTAVVPLLLDRAVGALDVYAVEVGLTWTATWVTDVALQDMLLAEWGAPTANLTAGSLALVAAGTEPLPGSSLCLENLLFTTSAATPVPTDIPITLTFARFNEGHPIAKTVNGVIQVRNSTDVPGDAAFALALDPARPNPARGGTRLSFTLPASARDGVSVRLAIFATDGRRVRTLLAGPLPAGRHEVTWDVRDELGRPVAAGVYFCRLECLGRALEGRLVVIR